VSGEVCVTCSDVALPLRVVAVGTDPDLAVCADAGGREETIEVALVAPVAIGEELLVHAGTAIARIEAGR
jgi:hydrogenase maturation factor